jgi:GNAT superfamily N-acetyltransferase
MRIRRATAADRTEALRLADRLAAFGPTTRPSEQVIARERRALDDALQARVDGPDLYVADDNEQGVVGVLLMETRTDYFSMEAHAYVSILAVAEGEEGRGIGSALLAQAERWASERGFRRLTLTAFKDNLRATELYTRRGWRPEFEIYFKLLGDSEA